MLNLTCPSSRNIFESRKNISFSLLSLFPPFSTPIVNFWFRCISLSSSRMALITSLLMIANKSSIYLIENLREFILQVPLTYIFHLEAVTGVFSSLTWKWFLNVKPDPLIHVNASFLYSLAFFLTRLSLHECEPILWISLEHTSGARWQIHFRLKRPGFCHYVSHSSAWLSPSVSFFTYFILYFPVLLA